MSKKLKTRAILILVLLIWGYNIYVTYQNHAAEELIAETEASYSTTSFSPMIFNKDSFELEFPVVDPFLKKSSGKNYSKNTTAIAESDAKQSNMTKTVQVATTPKKWPKIKYLGFVKNRNQGKTLCLIQINNKTNKVGKGQEQSGIYVADVYRDSVHLVFANEQRTFSK